MGRIARETSDAAYAKRINVSRQRVSALKKQGKLKLKLKSGTIDHATSVQMHRERLEAQKSSPSRQIKELYDAKTAKVNYEKLIGSVVDRRQMEQDAFRIGRIVRDSFMSIPDRMAGLLAAETDQKKIHAMLMKEFRQVLEVLAHDDDPASTPA